MNYTIDFCLISFLYLSITTFYYFRQPKVPEVRVRAFSVMLLCGLFSILMDVVAALSDAYAMHLPAWLLYTENIIFLLSVQLTVVLFFFYTMILTGVYIRLRRLRIPAFIPFMLALAMLLLSPFSTHGAFYLNENNVYCHGATHPILYITTGIYLLGGLIAVILRRKTLRKAKLVTILGFITASFIAMLVQFWHPRLLVNSMANAFSLTLIYHVLEAPNAHTDSLTGALNRRALPVLLSDLYVQGQRCTLLIIPIRQLRLVNHSIGMKNGDLILAALAVYFKRVYPTSYVIRMAGDVFALLRTDCDYIDAKELPKLLKSLPDELFAGEIRIKPDLSIACINSEDAGSDKEMLALTQAILTMHQKETLGKLLLADAEFREKTARDAALEAALARALEHGGVDVWYQPIHDTQGTLVSLEALVRIFDDTFGMLPTQEAVELAERKGLIEKLGRQVLCKTCRFIAENAPLLNGMDHIGVNLSALQCMRKDLSDTVLDVTRHYGVGTELLSFEVTETAFASVALVRGNMRKLSEKGYRFLLDDFGKGYSSFSHIATLPFHCVKIDKSILWDAMKNEECMRFLQGVVRMLKTLNLKIVCEGVETAAQSALLGQMGVDMLQGYLYSKPLNGEAVRRYIAERRPAQ